VPSPFAFLSSAPSLFASPRAAGVSFASGGESPSPRVFASSRSPSSRPSSAVVAVGETPSRARSSFSVVFADWLFGMGVSSATAKGKRRGRVDDDWSASVAKLKRVFLLFRARKDDARRGGNGLSSGRLRHAPRPRHRAPAPRYRPSSRPRGSSLRPRASRGWAAREFPSPSSANASRAAFPGGSAAAGKSRARACRNP
jgi:hypothetical protein